MSMQPTERNGTTVYNQKQTVDATSTRTGTSLQTDSAGETSNSSGETKTERNLTSTSIETKAAGERVNIGMQISFVIPIESKVPIMPGTSC